MKKNRDYEELEREQRELNQLVDEALKKGIPISQCDEIIKQSRKVDALIDKIQKERNRKNQWER
jgi:hypothetical protein